VKWFLGMYTARFNRRHKPKAPEGWRSPRRWRGRVNCYPRYVVSAKTWA
jgi:hypothetical protein